MKYFTLPSKFLNSSIDKTSQGFTLIEVLITVTILAITLAIALPSLNTFIVQMRVDNAITETHRLILVARNTAINTGKNTTLCPLNASNACSNDWEGEISVFANNSNDIATNSTYNSTTDQVIKIKAAVKNGDSLTFAHNRLIYSPTGRLISNNSGSFNYCPKDYLDESRGIDVTTSGRAYISSDIDNDQKDESRTGTEITCS